MLFSEKPTSWQDSGRLYTPRGCENGKMTEELILIDW